MTVIQAEPNVYVDKLTSGTAASWINKQTWAKYIRVIIVGGGGPGGGGARYAAATSPPLLTSVVTYRFPFSLRGPPILGRFGICVVSL